MLDLTQLEALITQLREIERDYKTKRADSWRRSNPVASFFAKNLDKTLGSIDKALKQDETAIKYNKMATADPINLINTAIKDNFVSVLINLQEITKDNKEKEYLVSLLKKIASLSLQEIQKILQEQQAKENYPLHNFISKLNRILKELNEVANENATQLIKTISKIDPSDSMQSLIQAINHAKFGESGGKSNFNSMCDDMLTACFTAMEPDKLSVYVKPYQEEMGEKKRLLDELEFLHYYHRGSVYTTTHTPEEEQKVRSLSQEAKSTHESFNEDNTFEDTVKKLEAEIKKAEWISGIGHQVLSKKNVIKPS